MNPPRPWMSPSRPDHPAAGTFKTGLQHLHCPDHPRSGRGGPDGQPGGGHVCRKGGGRSPGSGIVSRCPAPLYERIAQLHSGHHPRQKKRLNEIPGTVPNLLRMPEGCSFHPRCNQAMEICRKQCPPMVFFDLQRRAACWKVSAEYNGKSVPIPEQELDPLASRGED